MRSLVLISLGFHEFKVGNEKMGICVCILDIFCVVCFFLIYDMQLSSIANL
uniref:Uncharacterized protein n=1 Tax=Setaria italica TaxID=4555 RepID=K3YP10_SETIT